MVSAREEVSAREDVFFQGFHFPIAMSGKREGERDGRLDQFMRGYNKDKYHLTVGGEEYMSEFLEAYKEGPEGEDPYIVLHMTGGHKESKGRRGCAGLVKIDWDKVDKYPLSSREARRDTHPDPGSDFFNEKFLKQRKDPNWSSTPNKEDEWYIQEYVIPIKPVEGTKLHIEEPISIKEWNKLYNGQSWKRSLKRNKNVRAPLSEWVEMLR